MNRNGAIKEVTKRSLTFYASLFMPEFEITEFHKAYYRVLRRFAQGEIKRLIITVHPQPGKSKGSSEFLPSYILGFDPDRKITIASYASTFAKRFNRAVQRIMDEPIYRQLFTNTILPRIGVEGESKWLRNSDEFEMVGKKGGLRVVGRGGALTGNTVDLIILDDIYKDFQEANSPVIREAAWQWYITVVRTRLHNESQELIVFTRWHEDDLIGRLEDLEQVVEITNESQIDSVPKGAWVKLNFEAIKTKDKTEIDQRNEGESLWENRHNKVGLVAKRNLDPLRFECLYQGNPATKEGLLYSEFQTYERLPNTVSKKNYTDTADEGTDYLCSICYEKGADGFIYLTDVLYTQKPMEYTEPATAAMIDKNGTRLTRVESNNGGRGFARNVKRQTSVCKIVWFHQSKNKESRILTNATTVTEFIKMPIGWEEKWPKFHRHITSYKRQFKTNATDDGADTLTGIIETEIISSRRRII